MDIFYGLMDQCTEKHRRSTHRAEAHLLIELILQRAHIIDGDMGSKGKLLLNIYILDLFKFKII